MMNPTASTQAEAFTLIELLVVIAIIALLLAILVPGLQKARELVYRIKCGSILKNFATASHSYSVAQGGYFVPASCVGRGQPAKMWPLSYSAGDRYWYENKAFRKYLEIDKYITAKITNLGAMPKEFLCPADKISNEKRDDEIRMSYGYNNSDWRPWTIKYTIVGYKVTTVTNPAGTINFIDSVQFWVDYNGAHYAYVWDVIRESWPNPVESPDPGPVYYRHSEGANVGFYDGHAQWLKKKDIFDREGYNKNPARTGMWTASGKMIPGWYKRWPD
jgi:prepilin-type processing-associated H-X9-DG protein/prepilin-type N-terminal cleavage/methylation domain-containing protein